MSLLSEMVPYTDGNGLAAPNYVPPGTLQGSDNGVSFTSEEFVMLKRSGEAMEFDRLKYLGLMEACLWLQQHGALLCRIPFYQILIGGLPNTQSPPDDHYALFNGCRHAGNVGIPRALALGALTHLGFANNEVPGKFTRQSFIYRQVPLIAALISACFPSWRNPGHILVRLLFSWAYLIAAIEIARSCRGVPINQTDPRRLSWHLVQTVKDHSLWCWLASRIWYDRLQDDYWQAYVGTGNAMRGVAAIYYKGRTVSGEGTAYSVAYVEAHPFSKYWID